MRRNTTPFLGISMGFDHWQDQHNEKCCKRNVFVFFLSLGDFVAETTDVDASTFVHQLC